MLGWVCTPHELQLYTMDEIEEYKQQIQTGLQNLQKLIHHSTLYSSDKKKWKQSCNKQISSIKTDIKCLEQQINELPASQVSQNHISSKQYLKKLTRYEEEYRDRARGGDLMAQNVQPQVHNKNSAILQVIDKGDETQGRIKELLISMDGTVEEGIKQSIIINQQLYSQIQQLDRINDKVKDTKSNLKRAKKSISYFLKALECDKCMMALILLNVLALIAVIVLLVKNNT